MAILISCTCGKKLKVKDELSGKRVKCPGCGKPIQVTEPILPDEEVLEMEEVVPKKTQPGPKTASRKPAEQVDQSVRGTVHWKVMSGFSLSLLVLDDDSFHVAALEESELKKVEKKLDAGIPVIEALPEERETIPLDSLFKIESNLYNAAIDFHSEKDGGKGKKAEKQLTSLGCFICFSIEDRDEIMDKLKQRLGWKREKVQLTALQAAWAPLAAIGFCFLLMLLFFVIAVIVDASGRSQTVRTNAIGTIFVMIYNLFGPMGPAIVCLPFILACIVWLILRVRTPPLMLTLTPKS